MAGQAYLQAQDFKRAAESFEVAVRALPDMKDAIYGLSRAHAGLGNAAQAGEYAEQFRKLAAAAHAENTENAKAFRDRDFAVHVAAQTLSDAARVYSQRGSAARAEALLLRAVRLEPANVEFLSHLQQNLQERGAQSQAAEIGERIVELAPQRLDQWLNLGWLYSQLNVPDKAIAACQRAIELSPRTALSPGL